MRQIQLNQPPDDNVVAVYLSREDLKGLIECLERAAAEGCHSVLLDELQECFHATDTAQSK